MTHPRQDPDLARHAALRVVRTLRDDGREAFLAGGCVRDELLGAHPTDYDVATDATPDRVRQLFPRSNMVGAAFGVVLVHWRPEPPAPTDRITVEVATFRGEGTYSDRRRPDSVHFTTAARDAQRRDFTINALFLDPLAEPDPAAANGGTVVRGRIIDYVGGLADLRARVIRAVGDPGARLDEDHLRALRAVRFAARLGFALEAGTALAIRTHARALLGVSRERIGDELRRMLAHPARAAAVALLHELGLDEPTLNQPPKPGASVRTLAGLPSDANAITGLAAWLLDRLGPEALNAEESIKAQVAHARSALCLSNHESAGARDILGAAACLRGPWTTLSVAKQKRWSARPGFAEGLDLLAAGDPVRAESVRARLRELGVSVVRGAQRPVPLVSGDDLIGLGLVPGPEFKRLLEQLYDAQLEGRIETLEQGLELARRLRV